MLGTFDTTCAFGDLTPEHDGSAEFIFRIFPFKSSSASLEFTSERHIAPYTTSTPRISLDPDLTCVPDGTRQCS